MEGAMKKAKPVSRVDNAQVRVTEWQFEPGAATGHHRHEFDYVVVPLVDGLLRLIAAGGESNAELRKGVAYFRNAGVEHDVINAGDKPLAFVEIELLDHPL
jgi:quercetin dioxygenase-like cupin family protein